MTPEELAARYESSIPAHVVPMFSGFWEGAAEGELRLPHCSSCGLHHWYPMVRCPHCSSRDWSWDSVGLGATLFTWTVLWWPLHPSLKERVGEVVAIVVPDGAPEVRLVSNVVRAERLEIGMALSASFVHPRPDFALPVFVPPGSAE